MEKFRAYISLSKKNLIYNIKNIRAYTKSPYICAIMKDYAYGHGDVEVAKAIVPYVDFFGVSTSVEALTLRKNFKNKNILILSFTKENLEKLIKENIQISISSIDDAKVIEGCAKKLRKKAKVQIAINSGMNRIGFRPGDKALKDILNISKIKNIEITGIFSHFLIADEYYVSKINKDVTLKQKNVFDNFVKVLEKKGLKFKYISIANSSGCLLRLIDGTNMIRPGIIIYGVYPSKTIKKTIKLKEVLSLYSYITFIKDVKKGEYVSYGRSFKAKKNMKVATISIGYGDGVSRLLSNKLKVLINGEFANSIGNITMDQIMIDVSSINCKVGDKVTIIGKDRGKEISVFDLSEKIKTIPHEIFTSLSIRVRRIVE